MYLGPEVFRKASTMGCPQFGVRADPVERVNGRLAEAAAPDGVRIVAYADDVSVLIGAESRIGIETKARDTLRLISEWGGRNRWSFSIEIPNDDDEGQHAASIVERASRCFGKLSRMSAASWGIRYDALRVLYRGTFVTTVTYGAGCWVDRVETYVARSTLLRGQRPALVLLTKAYRSVRTAALPVLAGVLPTDLEVTRASRLDLAKLEATKAEIRARKRGLWDETIAIWQERWTNETRGSVCFCGMEDEDMHHVLSCPLYAEMRMKMMNGITREDMEPIYYTDLVSCKANFDRLVEFARAWHRLRGRLEEESRRR
ncbi:Retrovirus-related Pol polyprotein from type-1 retrotransposable element R1 2 [Eumeta japonica]|uniref:Retrovirus-related Pol polyprotein from type-1 retrotransposable element R1 2 n=1 Tax=Eumeta variegata TaxID=151549 RepID=A0A4C1XLA5_EUMVA|nr:Retrovirus-related Pol polyprotein from type-1 retrotransposable element R1 2 [Eumeta japonica]